MIEKTNAPKPMGKVHRGKVKWITGCCTVLRKEVRYQQVKPVPWDADKRWHTVLYVRADIENEYGLRLGMWLMLPVKLLDEVLKQMHLPLMSDNHKHHHWDVEDVWQNTYINRQLLILALNRHKYDVLWQCDDENGRVIYDLTMRDTRCAIKDEL